MKFSPTFVHVLVQSPSCLDVDIALLLGQFWWWWCFWILLPSEISSCWCCFCIFFLLEWVVADGVSEIFSLLKSSVIWNLLSSEIFCLLNCVLVDGVSLFSFSGMSCCWWNFWNLLKCDIVMLSVFLYFSRFFPSGTSHCPVTMQVTLSWSEK